MLTKPHLHDQTEDDGNFVDELKPGTELLRGQYTIERFLNAGGFGITYLARDSLDRKVVIKECFPGAFCRRSRYLVQARSRAHQNEFRSIVRLFVQEARSLAKLDHPNIVGVHQVFEDNETAYMALDFVEGRDLLQIIEDPKVTMSPAQVAPILRAVLRAVAFIHDKGMLHRDISPDNILITPDQNPVLIDFGAARDQVSKQSRALSALRVVKDGYSPQEFYISGSEQNASSDLYALAASFHHLITGDLPPNAQARLAAIASGDPDPYIRLAGRLPDYDNRFLAALDKALQVLPKDRVKSAKDWLAMLDRAKEATPTPTATAPAPRRVKLRIPLLIGTAVGLVMVGWAGVILTRPAPLPRAVTPQITVMPGTDPVAIPGLPTATAEALPTVSDVRPAMDNTTPAFDLPSDPVAVSDAGSVVMSAFDSFIPGIPAQVLQFQVDQHVRLPFDAAGARSNIIARAAGDAPEWVAPGLVVVDVNGAALTSIADISALLQDQIASAEATRISVTFGLRDPASGDRLDAAAALPVVQTLTLSNGYIFETSYADDKWSTHVTAVPAQATGGLQTGDLLVTHIPTARAVNARNSLAELLQNDAIGDIEDLIFAVQRNGTMWVASLSQGGQD